MCDNNVGDNIISFMGVGVGFVFFRQERSHASCSIYEIEGAAGSKADFNKDKMKGNHEEIHE